MTLELEDYRSLADLDALFHRPEPLSDDELSPTIDRLMAYFAVPCSGPLSALPQKVAALKGHLTVRGPEPIDPEVEKYLDRLLHTLRASGEIVYPIGLETVRDRLPSSQYPAADTTVLWKGDITALAADAIVNAANSQMLGCFVPFHACIDNSIHWAAGPRLRADCAALMRRQGHEEPTGLAKATRAWNLPSRYILHTVGPIVRGLLQSVHCEALASSYRSCMDVAAELDGVHTLAFCGISTGVFGFPKAAAAQIAIETVAEWKSGHAADDITVIFNVFSAEDEQIYEKALLSFHHD